MSPPSLNYPVPVRTKEKCRILFAVGHTPSFLMYKEVLSDYYQADLAIDCEFIEQPSAILQRLEETQFDVLFLYFRVDRNQDMATPILEKVKATHPQMPLLLFDWKERTDATIKNTVYHLSLPPELSNLLDCMGHITGLN